MDEVRVNSEQEAVKVSEPSLISLPVDSQAKTAIAQAGQPSSSTQKPSESIDRSFLRFIHSASANVSEFWQASKHLRQGDGLYRAREYAQALEAYERAREVSAESHRAWLGCARCLQKLARYEEALESYHRATQLQPEDYWGWMLQGNSSTSCNSTRWPSNL